MEGKSPDSDSILTVTGYVEGRDTVAIADSSCIWTILQGRPPHRPPPLPRSRKTRTKGPGVPTLGAPKMYECREMSLTD